ncbi:MAG: chromate efflux transporter [Bacillota bacterium]|nr:chromate efflux transporter [Bacillota bacterium]
METPSRGRLGEVAAVFLKLGVVAFGGPAAHVALMRQEMVERRRWLGEQDFLDLFGAANLIPGPSSTEMAIFLGYARAGWPGLLLAGGLFILPAMLLVLLFAWAYVRFGSLPQVGWLLYGIKPVIVAVVVDAVLGLARTAVKGWGLAALGAAVAALYLGGLNVVLLLFGAAAFHMLVSVARRGLRPGLMAALPLAAGTAGAGSAAVPAAVPFALQTLFLTFLKIGAVVFGSGYVLLAFLRADFVQRLGWLSDRQLIDAVAVGQFTPGPVFTTATFIGYLTGGLPGALLATLAIFLPSFVFVAAVYPLLPRLRGSAWVRAFLDGANVAALGLMAVVTWQLGRAGITDLLGVALAVAAFGLLRRLRINSAWLVLAGGLAGALVHLLG